jgi:Na+-translocating ferredoxin:NAD+ oxidoreductase subunit B
VNPTATSALLRAIDDALPQTQCTRCGYPDCRSYARAIAEESVEINRCPPGGAEGITRLAAITRRPAVPLDATHGVEGPRRLAIIDEAWCIGCTLCLKACPVDCIVGGPKTMHTVVESLCTGCELCIPVCPVDCISLVDVTGTRTGWNAWSQDAADEARERYAFHRFRLERESREHDDWTTSAQSSRLRSREPRTAARPRASQTNETAEFATPAGPGHVRDGVHVAPKLVRPE